MKSQLAVLMFADLVGYSAMMEEDPERAVATVRSLRSEHLEPVAEQFGGEILKRLGDGWIIGFGSVAAPVDCAIEVQTRLQTHPDIKLRIGCHIGEIVQDDDDFYGAGVNIAQRIQTEAPPGGLMVSEDLFRQLSKSKCAALKEAGTFRLKNIAQPVRLYQWRPPRVQTDDLDGATSIAVPAIEFAPQNDDIRALAGDLREQLIVRMSRRVGVVIFDAEIKPAEHATYELRSRLRIAGGRGRMSLTLILRSDGRPVWSEIYEGDAEDAFEFCDNLLERADGDLRLQINAFDGDRLVKIPDEDLNVSELRARAANLFYRVTYEDWAHGLALMERAVRLSPQDGIALSMRAEAQIMLHAARYQDMDSELEATLAQDLDIAVEQAPRSDYVFWTRATFRANQRRDIAGARADLERSRLLNPAYLENHELEGHILMLEGRFDAAAESFGRLLDRQKQNPLLPYRQYLRAVALFCADRFEDAADLARQAADIRPNEAGLRALQALSLEQAGRQAEGGELRKLASDIAGGPSIAARRPLLPDSHVWLADAIRSAGT